MIYLISYDLDKPSQNYAALTAYLTSNGAVRVLESEWVTSSQKSAVDLANDVLKGGKMGDSDRLLVLQAGPGVAWKRLLVSDGQMQNLLA